MILATASNAKGEAWLISGETLKLFLEAHKNAKLVLHNAAFDRNVMLAACGVDLCDWLDRGMLFDTMLLEQLIVLAETGQAPPYPSLKNLALQYAKIELDKDEGTRSTFGSCIKDGIIDLSLLGEKHFQYAMTDAIATAKVFEKQSEKVVEISENYGVASKLFLSHDIQLKASISLNAVSANGLHIDALTASGLKADYEKKVGDISEELKAKFAWSPGNGARKRYNEIMKGIEEETGASIPKTNSGDYSQKEEDIEGVNHPFAKLSLEFQRSRKLLDFIGKYEGKSAGHPKFDVLKNTGRTDGEPYSVEMIDWCWRKLEAGAFPKKKKFSPDIAERKASPELAKAVFSTGAVVMSSGRVRTFCNYCQSKNSPFQGMASDGAKLALYRLFREGFRVVCFVHDEIIAELPAECDHFAEAEKIRKIMTEEMRMFTPDVKIGVEYALMSRWRKGAEPVYDDPKNPTKLLLWSPVHE